MSLYNKSGGKVLVGLERRRAAEQRLFESLVKEVESVNNNIPDEYAKEAVSWAQENGILKGDSNGNLWLHQPPTLQKVIVIAYRIVKLFGKA